MDVGGVGEDEVDDYAGGDVDGDPGDGVLAREFGGDLAEVLGACYYLGVLDVMLACGGDDGDCKIHDFFCGRGGALETYTRQPFLLIPHPLLLRHRTRQLTHSANQRGNPALVRAGFEQQLRHVFRLAVPHRRGNREVVKRLFRNLLAWVFGVPVAQR